ncbi:hypothetical protein AAOGI_41220 [Agarivorans albus]
MQVIRKSTLRGIVPFTLMMVSFICSSSEIKQTKIMRTMMDLSYAEVVFVQVSGTPSRNQNCHSNTKWDYVLKTDTDLGKQMLTQLIAAQAAQKSVDLSGNDVCPVGATEQLRRIEVY